MSMAVFELRPVAARLVDACWRSSWHEGPCQVVAPSVRRARAWAASAFTVAADASGPRSFASPWLLDDLVEAIETRIQSAEVEGTVQIRDWENTANWFSVNASDTPMENSLHERPEARENVFQAECDWARLKASWRALVSPLFLETAR